MQDLPAHQRRLDLLPWPIVVEQARRRGSTVIWPFGAIEQHGPHLPLATDAVFAERITEAVLKRLDSTLPLWRLPVQSLGFSPEHRGFPGTISLPASLLIEMVTQVGLALAEAGFRRLVLFNAHGGQIGLLETAARELRSNAPHLAVLPCFLWRGPEGIAPLIPEPERRDGLHAGLAETSLMLHLAPELSGPLPAADGPSLKGLSPPEGWSLEGAAPSAWLTHELSVSGVVGDPTGASAQLGSQLFEGLVTGWVNRLEALMRSDWPATGGLRCLQSP